MNALNLSAYGVCEMNCGELSEVYGGSVAGDLGRAIGYALGYAAGWIKDAVLEHGEAVANSDCAVAVVAYK
jgi:hypothetical protein